MAYLDWKLKDTPEPVRDQPHWEGGLHAIWTPAKKLGLDVSTRWVGRRFDFQVPAPLIESVGGFSTTSLGTVYTAHTNACLGKVQRDKGCPEPRPARWWPSEQPQPVASSKLNCAEIEARVQRGASFLRARFFQVLWHFCGSTIQRSHAKPNKSNIMIRPSVRAFCCVALLFSMAWVCLPLFFAPDYNSLRLTKPARKHSHQVSTKLTLAHSGSLRMPYLCHTKRLTALEFLQKFLAVDYGQRTCVANLIATNSFGRAGKPIKLASP